MPAHVYILASRRHGTLYVGVSTQIETRLWQHRDGVADGFTKRHNVKRLVYVETHDDVTDAIQRERRIKDWHRDWKINLIERDNPNWDDLAVTLLNFEPLPSPKIPFRAPGENRDPRRRNWS